MSTERIDPEVLAAFLEGKLEPAERQRVLRVVAENPEEYEVFADAARVQAELEGTGVASVVDLRTRTPRRRWAIAIPALIAAGLATLAIWPWVSGKAGLSPIALAGPLHIVDVPGDGSLARRLGTAWDQPGWSITRGGASDVIEPARAFRLGVRATDVELALGARDSLAARTVGTELAELATGIEGGAAAAELYRGIIARGAAAPAAERRAAVEALRGLLQQSVWFDLGAWIEAARIAVTAGRLEFVRDRIAALQRLKTSLGARPEAERGPLLGMLFELDARVGKGETDAIQEQLTRIIVTAGR